MTRFVVAVSCAHMLLLAAYVRLGAVRPWQMAREAFGDNRVTWIIMYVSAACAPFLIGALLWSVDAWLRRRPVRWAAARESAFVLLSLAALLMFVNALVVADPAVRGMLHVPLVAFVNRHAALAAAAALLAVLVAVAVCAGSAAFRHRAVQVCRAALLVLSPAVVLSIAGLGYVLAFSPVESSGSRAAIARERPLASGAPVDVVMLVFDGLSYDAVFSETEVNERLPALHALAGQSVVFHNMHGVAGATKENMPILLTGGAGAADGRRSLFDAFYERGYQLVVHGTGVRYCTTYIKGRGECRSNSFDLHTPTRISRALMEPYWLALENVVPYRLETALSSFAGNREAWRLEFHQELLAALDAAPAGSFVYAHYPVPHHPYLRYDPTTRTIQRTPRDAVGVQTVDQFLQEVVSGLQRLGRWQHALIMVTSDHPDRSRDRRGTRVPLLVKLPGEHERVDYDGPLTHAQLLEVIDTLFMRGGFSPKSVVEMLPGVGAAYEVASSNTGGGAK